MREHVTLDDDTPFTETDFEQVRELSVAVHHADQDIPRLADEAIYRLTGL
ncbi:hypothetical protein [Kitasatospora kifunensis]|uniref:Uncharacterized protein n=1 Tax=Kitasatospora kifunensis TaxID=58351 RepID=A0A7W7QZZ0_KITKI|nr:hypothetical protein [Kitasatospora kifunensis]MBB4922241.1 hypothetical protein [Kitasatospora kifunensis]